MVIDKNLNSVSAYSNNKPAEVVYERWFVLCSRAHFSSQCRWHATLTILQMAKTHTHTHTHTHTTHDPVEDSERLQAAPGLYEQNRLRLQLQQIYTVLQPDINNVMLHKDRQTRCILGSTGLCCCRRSSGGGKGGKGGEEDLGKKTGGSWDVKKLWNDCVSTSREKQ